MVMSMAAKMQLKNLSFVPFQTREGVKEVLDVSDAVMISYKPFQILETGSPNKHFDGLAAGKLIVTNFGGWISKEIHEERCGITIDQKLQDDFPRLIAPFLANSALVVEYQQAARRLAEAKYSRRKLSERFVEAVQGILSR